MKNVLKEFLIEKTDYRFNARGIGVHNMIEDDEIQTYVNNSGQYAQKTDCDFRNFPRGFDAYYKRTWFKTSWNGCDESNDEVSSYRISALQKLDNRREKRSEK